MKKMFPLLIFMSAALVFCNEASSSSIVISSIKTMDKPTPNDLSKILSLKIRDIEKMIGQKLSLKEKIGVEIFKLKLKKEFRKHPLTNGQADKGQLALVLGIIGLAALLIPYAGLVSLPCAIAALIIGYNARRQDPSNRKARTAITLGWITIGIFIVALIIVIAVLTSLSWY